MKSRYVVWRIESPSETSVEIRVEYVVCPVGRAPGPNGAVTAPVSPALPLAYAERIAALLERSAAGRTSRGRGRAAPEPQDPARRLRRRLRDAVEKVWAARRDRLLAHRAIAGFPELAGSPLPKLPSTSAGASNVADGDVRARRALSRAPSEERGAIPDRADQAVVFAALEGRSLLGGEVRQALRELGCAAPARIDEFLDPWVQAGEIERAAAVGWDEAPGMAGRWRCRRCGSEEVALVPCAACGSERCPQCSACGSLGRSSACVALYHRPVGSRGGAPLRALARSNGSPVADGAGVAGGEESVEVSVQLPFALSPRQAEISEAIAASKGDALVWAACGAGKTEVTYAAIEDVIRRGGRALFSVPRRDVVQQLGERLQAVFRGVHVVALHGGTPFKYASSPLIVATAHQAVRFRECFDLLVIDEVDAFPLSRELWLRRALERTLKAGGRAVYMTATPPERLVWLAQADEIETHVLPARPHGRPLPVPETFAWGGKESGRLAAVMARAQASVDSGRKVILFAPTVRKVLDWYERLRGRSLGRVGYIHGSDRDRSEKLKAAERGEIDVLVSTTVLERGVTIPKVDVIVAEADDERVFDAATLIQMAGRSGRRADDPHGRVAFFARRSTPAMTLAVETIRELNRIAAREAAARGRRFLAQPADSWYSDRDLAD